MTSRQRALDAVQPRGRTGVEIGPLNRPLIRRDDGEILYADHRATADLRTKYATHPDVVGPDAAPLMEVDLVLDGRTLTEALGPRAPVDYIVASHVMEHVADPVGWLGDMAACLREDGVLFLAVPDKRFTFDFRRAPSTTGDLVAHHLSGATTTSSAQIFEHTARTASVDLVAIWAGAGREPPPLFDNQLVSALRDARMVAETGAYFDAHCTVYTPVSFLTVFGELIALDLIPFEIAAIEPTEREQLQFYVTLRKRAAASPAERAAATPRLDPRRHHDLPEPPPPPPLDWRERIALAWRVLRTGRSTRGDGAHG